MKKAFVEFAAVFMLSLVMGTVSASAEGELLKEFVPVGTNAMQKTAKAWFSTEDTRAALTFCLALDYYFSTDDPQIMWALAGDSCVLLGTEGSDLTVMYYYDGVGYDILYHPEKGTAECVGPMEYTEDEMERTLVTMKILGPKCYANSEEKMIETGFLLLDVMMEYEDQNR